MERSRRTDGTTESTPEEHADDLRRPITAIDAGPVDIFASSGGAVNALSASRSVHAIYQRSGFGTGMAAFIALAGHHGPIPSDFADQPAPDPAQFAMPVEDDGSRDDALLGQNLVSCTHYQPDLDALRAASTRIVIGAGAGSEGELAHRAAVALAERLGEPPVIFPSHHGGFLGGEYGQTGDPDAFAAALRRVIAEG